MGLQEESSGVYWADAVDDDELQKLFRDHQQGRDSTTGEKVDKDVEHETVEIFSPAEEQRKTAQHPENEGSDEDEYTFNEDIALQDAQFDSHLAYQKGQTFYDPVGFNDFALYMRAKRRKLGVQQTAARRNANADAKSNLLKGLRIHINGETEPPAHVLSHLVVLHGGIYVPYLDAKKTSASHIIASTLTPSKRVQFKEYKVVRAEWLMDSIRDKKIKDWRNYREDQTPVLERDMGIAPSGTQIVQPKLDFGNSAKRGLEAKSSSSPLNALPIAPELPSLQPAKATRSVKLQSPRRLPPPTSDPITLLHAEGSTPVTIENPAHPALHGWYQTRSNAKSAELLKDERWRLNETAVNTTEFLEKYYRESRLHWLSTWKAELKKLVGDLSEKQGKSVELTDVKRKKQILKGTEEDGRVILHVDFDSFFVSASLLAKPHLKGLPVVVCHASVGDANSSSEIASASYEARSFGIRNGMSLGSARGRCPQLQTVPYDFDLYRSISAKFYEILFSHTQELEAVSIDEAYISLPTSSPTRNGPQLLELAESIRSQIRKATGCETSIGVSHNKLLARLATNRAKPSSTYQVGNGVDPTNESLRVFLQDIDVESLPGIGWKRANDIEDKLKDLDARLNTGHFARKRPRSIDDRDEDREKVFDTVGKLLGFQKNQLKEVLGEKTGEMLFNYARGIDNRDLETETIRKSVSAEYGIRFKADDEVEKFCYGLGGEVASRLVNLGYQGRQLTLKVMRRAAEAPIEPPKFLGHGVCDVVNASRVVDLTNDPKLIGRTAWELMQTMACPPEELRGIGLQMQKLENAAIAYGLPAGGVGQGKLTFKAIDKLDTKPEVPFQTANDVSKLMPKSPINIVGNSSSSPQTKVAQGNAELRTTRSRAPVSYIELSTSSGEGSAEEDLKILSQAPSNFKQKDTEQKARQTLLHGAIVKRSSRLASAPTKQHAIVIPATSPAGVALEERTRLASPTQLTDKQFYLLGIDSSFFRSCSRPHQYDILRECLATRGENNKALYDMLVLSEKEGQKGRKKKKASFAPVFEQAAANKAKKEEALRRKKETEDRLARGPVFYKLRNSIATVPKFADKMELDDIRTVLGEWMLGVGLDHAPALEEVEDLASFCLNSISRDVRRNGGMGPDVAKICGILDWWKYLINGRKGMNLQSSSQKSAAEAWMDAYTDVKGKVSIAVKNDWGAPLYIDQT